MFNLDDITVLELFTLTDEVKFGQYMQLAEIMNPKGEFIGRKAPKLSSLTYDEVGQIKHNLSNPSVENIQTCFEIVFRCKPHQFQSQRVTDFLPALNWLKQELALLIENEKALSSDLDPVLEAAGVERLAAFGELNTLVSLGKQYGKSPDEVGQWKYSLVFALMLHQNVQAEVEKTYNELKSNESKRKA